MFSAMNERFKQMNDGALLRPTPGTFIDIEIDVAFG
jgi:hypothetical protein